MDMSRLRVDLTPSKHGECATLDNQRIHVPIQETWLKALVAKGGYQITNETVFPEV